MKELKFKTDKSEFTLNDGGEGIPLKKITEEQASEIVKMTWISSNPNLCKFKNYDVNGNGSLSSAIESLHSLLKSKGINLFENPCERFSPYDSRSKTGKHDWNEEDVIERVYKEAESKTFYNPCISFTK